MPNDCFNRAHRTRPYTMEMKIKPIPSRRQDQPVTKNISGNDRKRRMKVIIFIIHLELGY